MEVLDCKRDHFAVQSFLMNLDNKQLTNLGGALGLSYPKLKKMTYILDEMVAAWLRREDNVLDRSGEPTWRRLVEALEKIGQRGVAEDIRKEKFRKKSGKSQLRKSYRRSHCYVATAILGICLSLLYHFWPLIMYNFNLYHSKSLPYLSENFVGREREMQEMLSYVDFGNLNVRTVNIIGSPGFGKSTLAIHVGHELVKKGDVVHYVNLADFPKTRVKLVLAEKILDSARIVTKRVTFERLLRWAREQYYNNLLILDNCDNVLHSQRKEFQDAVDRLVKESKSIKVVFTSRKLVLPSLSSFEWFKVGELSNEAAYGLIEAKVSSKVDLTKSEMDEIIKGSGNVPLALQIVGSLLSLPGAPSPSRFIDELKEDPITLLTPPDFPANEQMFTTINLSYKYLSTELKEISRQLSVFPGSFELCAARDICSGKQVSSWSMVMPALVKSSLLEYNQRTCRYQYHQLIREYFLYVQRSEYPTEGHTLRLKYQIHYANMLLSISDPLREQYELSLATIDLELHNIQHLFQAGQLSTLPTEEFLLTAAALASGMCVRLLTARFSNDDLCKLVHISLNRLDDGVTKSEYKHSPHIHRFEESWQQNVPASRFYTYILSQYVQLIHQEAACEGAANGTMAASRVFIDRKSTVENRSLDIEPKYYKTFFTTLSNYYSQQGYDEGVIECHRLILERMTAHVIKCEKEDHCDFYDIGAIYFELKEYREAAKFCEQALSRSFLWSHRLKIIIKLILAYDKLKEQSKYAATLSKMLDLRAGIALANSTEIFQFGVHIMGAIEIYRKEGYYKNAALLEERLISSIKEVPLDTITPRLTQGQHGPLGIAFKVVNQLYRSQNYSETIKLGKRCIRAYRTSPDFVKEYIVLQVLVGQALFHSGNYSAGLDLMDRALSRIVKQNFPYTREKATACWYLILRFKYINACYDLYGALHELGSVTPFIIFSPYPFPDMDATERFLYAQRRREDVVKISDRREVVAMTQDFGVILRTNFRNIKHGLVSKLANQFRSLVLFLLSFDREMYCVLYIALWVLVVWLKLMWLFLLYRAYSKLIFRLMCACYYVRCTPSRVCYRYRIILLLALLSMVVAVTCTLIITFLVNSDVFVVLSSSLTGSITIVICHYYVYWAPSRVYYYILLAPLIVVILVKFDLFIFVYIYIFSIIFIFVNHGLLLLLEHYIL